MAYLHVFPLVAEAANSNDSLEVNASAFPSLAHAVQSPSTANKIIVITNVVECNDLTIPNDRNIEVKNGGKIRYHGHLQIDSTFTAGLYQVFEAVGTGDITFGEGVVKEIYPQWWGAKGDNMTDCTIQIQSAINAAKGNIIFLPKGTYIISAPINFATQRILRGAYAGTVIKASSRWNPKIPSIRPSTYSPKLSNAPMLYNQSTIDWWSIEGIGLDGNNQDCYGLWLAENFHGSVKDVLVYNTNRRPYTNIRGQSVTHINFTAYDCKEGIITYDTTGISFLGSGFERLRGAWYYDQRQPAQFAKGGVLLDNCWFESAKGASPEEGFLRTSGRRVKVNAHFAYHTRATSERMVELNGTSDTIVVDGIKMGAQTATMGEYSLNDASGSMTIKANHGTYGNKFGGNIVATKIKDQGSGNNFDINASLYIPVQHVINRFQVRYGVNGAEMPISPSSFVIDADYNNGAPIIRLFGNDKNYLDLMNGNLRLNSNMSQQYVSGGSISWTGRRYMFSGASGPNGYTAPVCIGTYSLWVDSRGKLRMKNGMPLNDADGIIVGTQN